MSTESNKDHLDAIGRLSVAQRRKAVGKLYKVGRTQWELARLFKVTQATISRDITALREQWRQQAAEDIGAWIARELSFAQDQRDSIALEWERSKDPAYQGPLIRWSERIGKLLGTDAPTKIAPTTPDGNQPYQAMSEEQARELVRAILGSNGRAPARAGPAASGS